MQTFKSKMAFFLPFKFDTSVPNVLRVFVNRLKRVAGILTSVPGLVAHLVDFVGLHRVLLGPVVHQFELAALVEGAAQVSLPLGRVGLIHSLLVFACLQGPGLGTAEKTRSVIKGKHTNKHSQGQDYHRQDGEWI